MPHSDVDDSASCAPSFTTEASDGAHGPRGAKKYKWHKRFAYQKFVGWRPILSPRNAGGLRRRRRRPPPPASRARPRPPPRCRPCRRALLPGRGRAAAGAGNTGADSLAQRGGGGCSPAAGAYPTARALPGAGCCSSAAAAPRPAACQEPHFRGNSLHAQPGMAAAGTGSCPPWSPPAAPTRLPPPAAACRCGCPMPLSAPSPTARGRPTRRRCGRRRPAAPTAWAGRSTQSAC